MNVLRNLHTIKDSHLLVILLERKKGTKKRSNFIPLLKWFIFSRKDISITCLYSRGGKKHQDSFAEVGALEGCFAGRLGKRVSLEDMLL